MFYKMIENKCKEWYNSENCTVRNLIEYIEKTGQMRDAQIEAIKVYLFLKIGCECKPLEFLFRYGCFNSINLNNIDLWENTFLTTMTEILLIQSQTIWQLTLTAIC